MKKLIVPFMCFSLSLSGEETVPGPSSMAFVKQFLVGSNGETITTAPIILDNKEGSFETLPLDGVAAFYELWVYPLVGPEGEQLTVDDAQLMDTEVVGVLPGVEMVFDGRDPHPTPRTRADFDHDVTITITNPVGQSNDGEIVTAEWIRRLAVRKRFLPEEFVGTSAADDNWIEVDSVPIHHTTNNQVESFSDSAFPPGTEVPASWSGLIEYQVVLADWPGSPLPLLALETLQVQVWPRWDVTFENVPVNAVQSLPGNVVADIVDIYPGTEQVIIDYLHKEAIVTDFPESSAVNLYTEAWTASTPQQRSPILSGLNGISVPGNYKVRVKMVYPWGNEDDSQLLAANGGTTTGDDPDSTPPVAGDEPTPPVAEDDPIIPPGGMTVSPAVLNIRGSIQSLK